MYVIIGGGMAGCAAAATLLRAGRPVTVVEAGGALGGRTRTVVRGGFGVEVGAIYLLNSYDRTVAMLADAGRSDLLTGWSPLAGLWDGQRLHAIRYDYIPSVLASSLLSTGDKVRLAARALQAIVSRAPDPFETDSLAEFDTGEDMESWARRRLGDNLFECFVRPLIEPSFGTDCRDLSIPYLQGLMKRAHRAKFFLPRAGMGSLCAELARGAQVRLDTEVTTLTQRADGVVNIGMADGTSLAARGVVVATDSMTAAGLLADIAASDALATMADAPYASMAHVNLRWDRDPWPGNAFEMLLPIGTGARDILGTIVKTARTSTLVPGGARMTDSYFSCEATRRLGDDELIAVAQRHVGEILGSRYPQPEAEVFRFDRALAICPPGHYARMRDLRASMPPRIGLAGDYLAHLGVETAVVSGERAARQLLNS
ncbi:protoporphyrinogen/coproporphyrinogen oxidase [Mycolicibacterium sp. 22603]|uniref:protoporphyrinogen/coproporphyrinogen oxidase n=1 Tax=Mycolicibacterium sp. 22603 TaxID=3453950 RepID=UPI003F83B146